MAGFRRMVNDHFNFEERGDEFYEDSQDQHFEEYSPSVCQRAMTSTPRPQSCLQPPFQMVSRRFHIPRQMFTPSFFDTQLQNYQERRTLTEEPSRPTGNSKPKKTQENAGQNRWTLEETDALVYAWRDSFVELESHKNPAAWRKIVEAVNKVGDGKSTDQAKKKLRNLKDRYKEAKNKNKRSGSARNLPKHYNVFDKVLGTRSVIQLPEVRESGQGSAAIQLDNPPNSEALGEQEEALEAEGGNVEESAPQPKRSKKKKASKSAASKQLVDFLSEMQKQQQETMQQFLDGMKEMEESSRKQTANTLLEVAKIFINSNKRRRESSDGDDE